MTRKTANSSCIQTALSLFSSKRYISPKFLQMKMVIKNEIHLLYKRSENVTKWHFHPTLASHKVCLSIQNIFFSLALSNLGMLAIYSWQNNLQIQNLPFWVFLNQISQFRSVWSGSDSKAIQAKKKNL